MALVEFGTIKSVLNLPSVSQAHFLFTWDIVSHKSLGRILNLLYLWLQIFYPIFPGEYNSPESFSTTANFLYINRFRLRAQMQSSQFLVVLSVKISNESR